MDGIDAVIEAPETGAEIEAGGSQGGGESTSSEASTRTPEDPYGPKQSKALSDALKAWRDGNPDNKDIGRFARQAKDDHGRLFQLHQTEPRGIDGVRETYAALQSIEHGELRGLEAVSAIQGELQNVAQMDERVTAGDASVLDEFSDEMKAGVLKMTPQLLNMLAEHDGEAYGQALLPHLVNALASSELATAFNSMVDVLKEAPPSWLTDNQKVAWAADRMQRVTREAGRMAQWFNAQEKKVDGLKAATPSAKGPGTKPDSVSEERAKFDREQQDHHWNTKIAPQSDKHAVDRFAELFRPFDKRLKLDPNARKMLMGDFVRGVVEKAKGNPVYQDQMKRFRGSKNPDPAKVLNSFKVEFDKHGKTVLESLVKARYGRFLNGNGTSRPAPVTAGSQNGNGKGPVGPKEYVVAVKPRSEDVNWRLTTPDLRHAGKFAMNDGRIAVWRH